jgi:hypothetical protein
MLARSVEQERRRRKEKLSRHLSGGLAQTLSFNVCDLPKAPSAEGCDETPRVPPWSLGEIADSKLRSLRQPAGAPHKLAAYRFRPSDSSWLATGSRGMG